MTERDPEATRSHTIGIWPLVHAERAALAADLADLTGEQVAMRLAEQLGATPAETIDRFRSVLTSTTKPPVPTLAMLGETIVHAQDIRLPLGIPHDYPIGTLPRLAEYYQASALPVLTRTRIKGLRLVATDGPFTTGSGPLVSGATLALIMAMAGRGAASCDELQGDGAATLRQRSQTP